MVIITWKYFRTIRRRYQIVLICAASLWLGLITLVEPYAVNDLVHQETMLMRVLIYFLIYIKQIHCLVAHSAL